MRVDMHIRIIQVVAAVTGQLQEEREKLWLAENVTDMGKTVQRNGLSSFALLVYYGQGGAELGERRFNHDYTCL